MSRPSRIECPRCGHQALSIASRCPRCGFDYTQVRRPTPRDGPAPRRLARYGAGAALVGAAVFLGGLVALRGKPANGEPAATQPSRPEAANTTVKAVDDSPPTSTSTPPAARDAPPAAAPLDTLDFQTRWTTTWVNVREGRGASQPVVRVLNPGVSVQVRDLRSGWWHVYVDNQPVGYVGNSVLQREPPS